MLDKNQQKVKEIEAQAKFDDIKEKMRQAREEAIEEAENPYRVEASQLAYELYALGLPKEAIHRANRDYQNGERRRRLWGAWSPDEPVEDLRSRGKGAAKPDQLFEWLEHEEFEDVVRITMESGEDIVFVVTVVNETQPHFTPLDDTIDDMVWWREYSRMRSLIKDSWNARRAARDI